jgi:hypothetical protein
MNMEVISGTIISHRRINSGCWYSIATSTEKKNFFSKKEPFSLFESCEVAVVNKNCSYFLYDYQNAFEDAPLKKFPENIVAASWFSILADSLHFVDKQDINFVNRCKEILSSGRIDNKKLKDIENFYLDVSGFGSKEDNSDIFREYFPFKMRIRNSLVNNIRKRFNQ